VGGNCNAYGIMFTVSLRAITRSSSFILKVAQNLNDTTLKCESLISNYDLYVADFCFVLNVEEDQNVLYVNYRFWKSIILGLRVNRD